MKISVGDRLYRWHQFHPEGSKVQSAIVEKVGRSYIYLSGGHRVHLSDLSDASGFTAPRWYTSLEKLEESRVVTAMLQELAAELYQVRRQVVPASPDDLDRARVALGLGPSDVRHRVKARAVS